jgi:hypothetical protein
LVWLPGACRVWQQTRAETGAGAWPAARPYGREQSRGADALLKAPIQAKPDRNVELRSRSQEREDDRSICRPKNNAFHRLPFESLDGPL